MRALAEVEELAGVVGELLQPVSPSLMSESAQTGQASTDRFLLDDTLPPRARARAAAPRPATRTAGRAGRLSRPREGAHGGGVLGRVFIKQGTIYSYTGNLTFVVKEKRPGAHPWLVMVIGSGRLILTDKEREITFMQVADEPVFVEPSHLLACEESLQPRYARLGGDEHGLEVVALEGRGMLALSVASKPLPLSVKPGRPCPCPPRPSSCGRALSSPTRWTTPRCSPSSCRPRRRRTALPPRGDRPGPRRAGRGLVAAGRAP